MARRPLRHVALNALFLDPGRSGGTETYLRGLAPALATEFPDLRLSILTTRRGAAALKRDGWGDWAKIVAFGADEGQRVRRLGAEQVLAGLSARRRRADVLHSLPSTGPIRAPLPHVVTVHDVTFLHHRTFSRSTTAAMRWIVTGAARHADALIAVSAAAREEICESLDIPRQRFTVVPNGAGRPPAAVTPIAEDEVRRKYDLPDGRRLVLCVAAVRDHKNQGLLVKALEHLPEDVIVMCAGAQEAYAQDVRKLARKLKVEDRLRLPGYCTDEELEALWGLAAAAAFPTRAEGFGLPVVEAMRRSVPVACSDIAVLHEVGGDVPVYFPPDDARAAARAIEQAMAAGPHPQARATASRFTWEAAARGTYEAYGRACTSA